jgi:hypothetical protein
MSDEQDRYDREFRFIVFCETIGPAIMAKINEMKSRIKTYLDDGKE